MFMHFGLQYGAYIHGPALAGCTQRYPRAQRMLAPLLASRNKKKAVHRARTEMDRMAEMAIPERERNAKRECPRLLAIILFLSLSQLRRILYLYSATYS